jgi:hypothetical protein
MKAEYKKLLAFHNNSTAIRSGTLRSYSNDDICAFMDTRCGSTDRYGPPRP